MPDSTVKVLIVFYSRTGVTEALAKAIAEGAEAEGATVTLRRAREIVPRSVMESVDGWAEAADRMNAIYEAPTPADVEAADAIIFGTPTRFGIVSSEVKAFMDSLGGLWFQGKLVGKVGGAFTSASNPHGGNETTILSLFAPLSHFGMIIVPPGYADPVMFKGGSPYGANAISGTDSTPPNEDYLAVARFQGKHTTQIAKKLKG